MNDKTTQNRILILLLFFMILLNLYLIGNNKESIESCQDRLYEYLYKQEAPKGVRR